LLFEKFRIGGFFLSKDTVLSCYACGKTSGLVLDFGYSGTDISPVIEGWAEQKALSRSTVGGKLLDQYMLNLVSKRHGRKPVPTFRVKKNVNSDFSITDATIIGIDNINPRFNAYALLNLGKDVKENTCKVANSALHDNEMVFASMPLSQYELPDGTIVDLGIERYQPPELYFNVSPLSNIDREELHTLHLENQNVHHATEDSIVKLALESLFKCDPEYQAPMLSNIIISGGSSAVDGLVERVKVEIETIIHVNSPYIKIKTISPSLSERGINPWIGGSIVGSLGSFHEMWVSKKEYEEFGSNIVDKKCP
jgi:actin-like protein 6A